MQRHLVVRILIGGGIDARQMVAVEDYGNRFVDLIELVEEVGHFLIGVVHALGICVDVVALTVGNVLRRVGLHKLVIVVVVAVWRVVLHGHELQELRLVAILLLIDQIENVLVCLTVAHIRRTVDGAGVRERFFAVACVQIRELEFLVVNVAQIHALLERMHRSGGGFAVLLRPNLIERVRVALIRHKLLVWHNQGIVEIGQIHTGQCLVFDIRGASAVAGGEHQAGCREVLDSADVRHWVDAETHARHARRIGEGLRQNQDHRTIGQFTATVLIDGLRRGGIAFGDLLHGLLAVVLRLIHGLDLGQAQERGCRAVVLRVHQGIPQFRTVAHIRSPGIGP